MYYLNCNFEETAIIGILVFISLFALWFIRPNIKQRCKDDDGENEITKSFIGHETKVILMMSLTLNFKSLMTHNTDWTLKHTHRFFFLYSLNVVETFNKCFLFVTLLSFSLFKALYTTDARCVYWSFFFLHSTLRFFFLNVLLVRLSLNYAGCWLLLHTCLWFIYAYSRFNHCFITLFPRTATQKLTRDFISSFYKTDLIHLLLTLFYRFF